MARYDGTPKHWHNQSCFSRKLVCGKIDHQHDAGCADKNGKLTCSKSVHTHGENCWLQATICGFGKYD